MISESEVLCTGDGVNFVRVFAFEDTGIGVEVLMRTTE